MLAKFLKDDLDLLLPNETKQVFEDFENKKNFETPKSFDEFLKEIKWKYPDINNSKRILQNISRQCKINTFKNLPPEYKDH